MAELAARDGTVTAPPLDRLGRSLHDLRLSVIDRCTFRCPYCMPEERYPRDHAFSRARDRLSAEEIVRLARVFVRLGVSKIRLTGGEPLLRPDLPEIVRALSQIPGLTDLALTTNGMLLERSAQPLKDAGLHRLTVSLDALDEETFRSMSGGVGSAEPVLRGIAAAQSCGLTPVKVNTVVMRGRNEHAVLPLLQRFRHQSVTVRLIEYMDVGTCNGWRPEQVVPSRELFARIHAQWPLQAVAPAYRGEVAERYRYADGGGEIGFISSVSQPFCGDCHRARVSAIGGLHTCLFGGSVLDLRALLRSGADDAQLLAAVAATWRKRTDRYSELRAGRADVPIGRRIEMYQIGG